MGGGGGKWLGVGDWVISMVVESQRLRWGVWGGDLGPKEMIYSGLWCFSHVGGTTNVRSDHITSDDFAYGCN